MGLCSWLPCSLRHLIMAWVAAVTTSSGFFAGIFFSAARHSHAAADWAIFAVALAVGISGIGGLAMFYAPCSRRRFFEMMRRRDEGQSGSPSQTAQANSHKT